MADTIAPVVDTIEQTLRPLGLMSGENAIPKRMAFGGVLGGMVVSWLKPAAMFSADGRPRPWKWLDNTASNGIEPTNTPWFLGPVVGAFFFGVLI